MPATSNFSERNSYRPCVLRASSSILVALTGRFFSQSFLARSQNLKVARIYEARNICLNKFPFVTATPTSATSFQWKPSSRDAQGVQRRIESYRCKLPYCASSDDTMVRGVQPPPPGDSSYRKRNKSAEFPFRLSLSCCFLLERMILCHRLRTVSSSLDRSPTCISAGVVKADIAWEVHVLYNLARRTNGKYAYLRLSSWQLGK